MKKDKFFLVRMKKSVKKLFKTSKNLQVESYINANFSKKPVK